MNSSHFTLFLSLVGGMLLAIMIKLNSVLAAGLTPVYASWVAHCIGAFTALFLIIIVSRLATLKRPITLAEGTKIIEEKSKHDLPAPFWSYLGGLPGALVVIFASISINSDLGLSGTLVLGLLGQIVFSLIVDHYGLFGMRKKALNVHQLLPVLCICFGCVLIILQGSF